MAAGDLPHLRSRHLDDSLALQSHVHGVHAYLDVGSGSGFPGVPLAVVNPDVVVTLVDRNQRKCGFLRHVVMALQLSNVRVIEADVRDLKDESTRFDAISARAVSSPETLWSWCEELLTAKGHLLLQSVSPIPDTLPNGVVESHRSTGIGWINLIRRAAA